MENKIRKNYKPNTNSKGLMPQNQHGIDGETHNDRLVSDGRFKAACEAAGIQPTKRQMSKYRRGFGAARNAQR